MRSDWLKAGLLAGVLFLGTGASTQGVRQADRWWREAYLAQVHRHWDIAYDRCRTLAETFPGMPHGRTAARTARRMQDWALSPDRASGSEDQASWTCELFDFLTWP